jgi:hypothetical protein
MDNVHFEVHQTLKFDKHSGIDDARSICDKRGIKLIEVHALSKNAQNVLLIDPMTSFRFNGTYNGLKEYIQKTEYAKEGDRVWSMRHGWGTIRHIEERDRHGIVVVFDHLNKKGIFTVCGKDYIEDLYPTLFWDKVLFTVPQKPIKMKLVHGVEVPDIAFKPTSGVPFYHPSLDCMGLSKIMTYNDSPWCQFLSENNLCYPYNEIGRAASVLHAKAMLGVDDV